MDMMSASWVQDPAWAAGGAVLPARPAARRRCRVGADALRLGMWVAELDRPWDDTPFLLHGFLIDSHVELDTLRRYCRHALVDLDQSSPELIDDIRQAEAHALLAGDDDARARSVPLIVMEAPAAPAVARRAPRVLKARADVRISDATRERFRELVRAHAPDAPSGPLLQRAAGWLRRSVGAAARGPGPRDVLDLLPRGACATVYRDSVDFEQELPRARQVIGDAGEVLAGLASDVRALCAPRFGDVRAAVAAMIESMTANADALAWIARVRDESPGAHHQAIKSAMYLVALGMRLGLPAAQLAQLGAIGMLADAGKARLPRALLDKPGMLSPAEYGIVKEHVQLGLEALAPCALPAEIAEGIAQHHERLDGSGYPHGLRGEQIGPWARMAAVADSYAALTTPRAYATPTTPQDALMSLYEWAGTSFDEHVVSRFVQAVGIFPVGSLIELSSGEVAAVMALRRARRIEPQVLVLTTSDKSPLAVPRARDLAGVPRDGRGVRIVRGLPTGSHGLRLRDYHSEGIEREPVDD